MIRKLLLVPLGILVICYLLSLARLAPLSLAALCLVVYLLLGVPLAHLGRALMRRVPPRRATDPVVLTLVFLGAAVAISASSVTTATLDGSVFKPVGQVNIGLVLAVSALSVAVVGAAMLIADGSAIALSSVRKAG